MLTTLRSRRDASVNFILPVAPNQALESRYVRRDDHKLVCYLSSQTACNAGCRFCHLTATGQTTSRDATVTEIASQAVRVLSHHAQLPRQERAAHVSFSFMARGEPLLSRVILEQWEEVVHALWSTAADFGAAPSIKLSTIMPRRTMQELADADRTLTNVFIYEKPRIYWSCYSAAPEFRRRWMPNALAVGEAAPLLASYARVGGEAVIHHAMLRADNGLTSNDAAADLSALLEALEPSGLLEYAGWNLVRYNAHPGSRSREASAEDYAYRLTTLRALFGEDRAQMLERVGPDVFASCGTFPSVDG